MPRFFKVLMGGLLVGGWATAALSVHVVRTSGGVQVLTKNALGFEDTWVDVRHWSASDEERHAAFYDRLKQLDKTHLLDGSSPAAEDDDAMKSAKEAWAELTREAAARRR